MLLLLLGCCCCSSFSISISGRRMERRHLFPPCDSYLIGRWNSLGICLRHFSPHPRRSKREITNSLSSAQQLTRRKALGEIKKTFFLSFVFFSFVRVKSLVHLLQLFFPSSVIRLLFVYQLFPSVSQFERERRRRESQCVCVCAHPVLLLLEDKKEKENLK